MRFKLFLIGSAVLLALAGCAGPGGGSGGMGGQGFAITVTQGCAEHATQRSEATGTDGKAKATGKGGNVTVIIIRNDDGGTGIPNPSQPSEERATQEPTTQPKPSEKVPG